MPKVIIQTSHEDELVLDGEMDRIPCIGETLFLAVEDDAKGIESAEAFKVVDVTTCLEVCVNSKIRYIRETYTIYITPKHTGRRRQITM